MNKTKIFFKMITRIVHIIVPLDILSPLAKTRKKIQKSKNNFFVWFWGLHKFVENRQIYKKDFKIYDNLIIFYEI